MSALTFCLVMEDSSHIQSEKELAQTEQKKQCGIEQPLMPVYLMGLDQVLHAPADWGKAEIDRYVTFFLCKHCQTLRTSPAID